MSLKTILIKRGNKVDLPTLLPGELGFCEDTKELFIGSVTGNRNISASGGGGVDLNDMAYFNYAGNIYGANYAVVKIAWESSLAVDPLEISVDSTSALSRGLAQYPDNETEGIIIPQGITTIGNYAFGGAINNKPLVIPNSVTSIGSGVFGNWTSNNQPLVIPNSVTSIGDEAFSGWSSNNHPLVIPNSVTSIEVSAFWGWSNVPYIEMKSGTPPTLVHPAAFDNQNDAPIYVPDASVNDYKAASNWADLADRIFSIKDKDKGTDISSIITEPYYYYAINIYGANYAVVKSAWEHSLTVQTVNKANYPDGETKGVIIPQGTESIGDNAFENWQSNNKPLVMPSSVTSIGHNAFSGWTANNQPLVIPDSVTSIGDSAFNGWQSNAHPLVIPDGVTYIGGWTFGDWTANNQPLVIPNSVTSIGNSAFNGWLTNNQPLVIPNGVTSIGDEAFAGWSANNHPLVIPDSVTSIGDSAFLNWSNVPHIEMKSGTPPTLADANAFANQNDAPIYVPPWAVDDYTTATNWVSLAARILPMNDNNMEE